MIVTFTTLRAFSNLIRLGLTNMCANGSFASGSNVFIHSEVALCAASNYLPGILLKLLCTIWYIYFCASTKLGLSQRAFFIPLILITMQLLFQTMTTFLFAAATIKLSKDFSNFNSLKPCGYSPLSIFVSEIVNF